MDRPVPGPTGSAPLFENDLDEGSGLTELAQMQRGQSPTAPAAAGPGVAAAPAFAGGAAPAGGERPPDMPVHLPPHMRGPQASPAPVRETHYGRWVLGTFALIVVGVLVIRAMGGEDGTDPSAPQPATAATAASGPGDQAEAPKAAAGPTRAAQWEQVATVLGELERHVNRAKLQFADMRDPAMRAAVPPPEPVDAPAGGAPDVPSQDQLDAPQDQPRPMRPAAMGIPAPTVDPVDQARAQEEWQTWASSWNSDLDFAVKGLPVRATLDPSVRTAYDAVSVLASQMRSLPGGSPPKAMARDAWLRGLLERVHDARKTVDATR